MPAGPGFTRCLPMLLVAMQLVAVPALAGGAAADGDTPAATSPGYTTAIVTTMDEAHSRLERNILEQAIKFDNFFGDVRTVNLRPTGFELRWKNSFRIENGGSLNYGASLRGNFVLSRISERLRLVITEEDEPGPFTQGLPKDPGNPGFDRTTPAAHFTNTEFRYELIQNPAMNLFLGAGVRITLPFEAFVRSRFQYTGHISDVSLVRVGETFFVKNTDLLGETTEISLERLFDSDTIIRWASSGTASEEIHGLEWGSELSLVKGFAPGSAVTLTGGVYGNTSSSSAVENSRLLVRYRSKFLRPWLFYELEPEISWPRDSRKNHPATVAFTFRIEIVFQGKTPSQKQQN